MAEQLSPNLAEEALPEVSPQEWLAQQRRIPTMAAVNALDDDPDEAAEAQKTGESIGVDGSLVGMDLEHWQKQHKAALTTDLFDNNEHLRDYVRQHPIGSSISNDDWGQLDKISQLMDRFVRQGAIGRGVMMAADSVGAGSIIHRAVKDFAEEHGSGLGIPPDMLAQLSSSPLVGELLNKVLLNTPIGQNVEAMRLISSLVAGTAGGVEQAGTNLGMPEAGKTASSFIQAVMDPGVQASVGPLSEAALEPFAMASLLKKLSKAAEVTEPYVKAGIRPPNNIDPLVHQGAVQEAKLDAKNLDELFGEVNKSTTKPRDPESMVAFTDAKMGDAPLGISVDKIRELYGDGMPEPDDNKLGWAPNIREQYELALKTGGDVVVPWKEFLARATPETYDVLKDGIRARPGGMTLDEAKEVKPIELEGAEPEGEAQAQKEAEPSADPVEALRNSMGMKLEPTFKPEDLIHPEQAEMRWQKLGSDLNPDHIIYLQPTKEWTEVEAKIIDAMDKYMGKIAPQFDAEKRLIPGRQVKLAGTGPVLGLHQPIKDAAPVIFYALHNREGEFRLPEDILGTVRHEAIHYLYRNGFFTKDEWTTLTEAAKREGWIVKHQIDQTYAGASHQIQLEEAVAHEYQKWNIKPESTHVAASTFQKMRTFFLSIANEVRQVLGWDPRVEDIFHRIEKGEIGRQKVEAEMAAGPEPGTQVMAQREGEAPSPFKTAAAAGMTKDRLEAYLRLIAKQQDEKVKFTRDQAQMAEAAKATKDYTNNYDRVREETKADMLARPDIAADRYFRTGELPNGEKLPKVPLDRAAIDPKLVGRLPPEFIANRGVHPDRLAARFGFQSGEQMVRALARIEDERRQAELTPAAHLTSAINRETERKMNEQYGRSAGDIVKDAMEHVYSPTAMDILHTEWQALAGEKAEGVTKKDVERYVKDSFDNAPLYQHSSDQYHADVGKAAQAAEEALLAGKPTEALQAKQEQMMGAIKVRLALKLEKQREQFNRLAGKYATRAPAGRKQEVVLWIQDILNRVGARASNIADLERQREYVAQHATLREFVESVNSNNEIYGTDPDVVSPGQQMPVADFLLDPTKNLPTPSSMTPPEFKALFDSIKTMDKYAREQHTSMVKGKRVATADVVSGLIERLKAAVGGKALSEGAEQERSVARLFGSAVLNPETWFNRLDLGNRKGPFSQLIMRPITEGQYTLRTLEKKYAKEWRAIGEPGGNLKDPIENSLFMDPSTKFTKPLTLNRGNLFAILQNMGNELQRRKLAGGYGIDDPNKIWPWLESHGITKEDVQRAQQRGDFFEKIFDDSATMYSELSGVVPEKIDLGRVQSPWGPTDEWYHPLIPNPIHHSGLKPSEMMGENGFTRPMPGAGYTKSRTGAIYPLELNFNAIPAKIKQLLNDIAMRPAITEVSKILLDKDFRGNFIKYYGKEYNAALRDWLTDAAGQRRYNPAVDAALDGFANAIRNNMATLMIGLNVGTVLKHFPTALAFSVREVGAARFADSMMHMIAESPTGQARWKFAMENSEELQNRLRSTKESIQASNDDLFRARDWSHAGFKIRDAIQTLGALPVAMSDFISAVPMWDAAYRKAMEVEGTTHGDGVYAANTAVRQTHGSSILTNRAAVMRSNPWVMSMLPFYNFFSNALQRTYELGWQSKLATQGRELPEMTGFEKETFEKGMKHVPNILGGVMTYGVLVSLIEQAVDPLEYKEDDDPIKWGAKVISRGPLSMIPGMRNLLGIYEGYEPTVGLAQSFLKDITAPATGKEWVADPGKALRTVNLALGAATGLSFDAAGKAAQFTYNVLADNEHPEDVFDYLKGIRHGTMKEKHPRPVLGPLGEQ